MQAEQLNLIWIVKSMILVQVMSAGLSEPLEFQQFRKILEES
jgi:hypothetical protein